MNNRHPLVDETILHKDDTPLMADLIRKRLACRDTELKEQRWSRAASVVSTGAIGPSVHPPDLCRN